MADAAMQLDDVPATPAIEIDNVSVTFGQGQNQVRAIDRISLDVRDGEFLTLIGHSGCGKSTLTLGFTKECLRLHVAVPVGHRGSSRPAALDPEHKKAKHENPGAPISVRPCSAHRSLLR